MRPSSLVKAGSHSPTGFSLGYHLLTVRFSDFDGKQPALDLENHRVTIETLGDIPPIGGGAMGADIANLLGRQPA